MGIFVSSGPYDAQGRVKMGSIKAVISFKTPDLQIFLIIDSKLIHTRKKGPYRSPNSILRFSERDNGVVIDKRKYN